MSISLTEPVQAERAIQTQQPSSPSADRGTGLITAAPVKTAYGSTPSAVVNISAQAKVAQAKAYAIKHGHDPDGVQDGK